MAKGPKWIVDSGILRKRCGEEEPQELLVFGYSCKLFRDDEKAKLIDQGKHLIPWMGDDSIKIDRYDGRGALGDLRFYELPPGGFDYRAILTEDEYKVEQLCDEERYRPLYNNEVEELVYHEEEIKRLHQALDSENAYNQANFNYDEEEKSGNDSQSSKLSEGLQDEDEVFVPEPKLELPEAMILPGTKKLDAIIMKTALFISQQGSQMEILIKAKQANNPQFAFLSLDGVLHPYYKHVLDAIKSGKFNPEKEPEKANQGPEEESDEGDESYLHPSLVSSLKVEAAPSIPSISYKPSIDCAYSLLVNKITGKPPSTQKQQEESQRTEMIPSTPTSSISLHHTMQKHPQNLVLPQQYAHGPVIYNTNGTMSTTMTQSEPLSTQTSSVDVSTASKETSPLVPYGRTPPKLLTRPSFIVPPADVQIIIDKMASYVAKNGRDFEAIVKNKGDPRFNFLELSHQYHGYYAHKLMLHGGAVNPQVLTEEELLQQQEVQEEKRKKLEELQKKQQRMEEVQKRVKLIQAKKKDDISEDVHGKQITTVSFSIKKPKEGESNVIEKRNALPMEESDDEVGDGNRGANLRSSSPTLIANEIISPRCDKDCFQSTKQPLQDQKISKSSPLKMTKGQDDSDKSCVLDLISRRPLYVMDGESIVSEKPLAQDLKLVKEQSNIIKPSRIKSGIGKLIPTEKIVSDVVDLTNEVNEDDHVGVPKKFRVSNNKKMKSGTGDKAAALKAKQLQMVRRKKAMMFLSQIQMPSIAKSSVLKGFIAKPECIEISAPSSSTKEDDEIQEIKMCTNSLVDKLEKTDLDGERARQRSRSRSSSSNFTGKHRSYRKHKKKKSFRKRTQNLKKDVNPPALLCHEATLWPDTEIIFSTLSKNRSISNRPNSMAEKSLDQLNNYDIEEADVKIMLHIAHSSLEGIKKIYLLSSDTDVLVFALSHWEAFSMDSLEELWMRAGAAKTMRNIPIHTLAAKLGSKFRETILPVHHSTGADYTSKVGTKGGAVKTNPTDYLSDFGKFSTPELVEYNVRQAELYLIQVLHNGSSCGSFNELRSYEYKWHSINKISYLPPTSASIQLHICRAYYCSYTQINWKRTIFRSRKQLQSFYHLSMSLCPIVHIINVRGTPVYV